MGIYIPNNAGDGALPVCSGNTEHLHFTAWMPIKHGRHPVSYTHLISLSFIVYISTINKGIAFFYVTHKEIIAYISAIARET